MTIDEVSKKVFEISDMFDPYDGYWTIRNLGEGESIKEIKKNLTKEFDFDDFISLIREIKEIKNEFPADDELYILCDEVIPELKKLAESKKQNEALYGTYSEKLYKIIQMLSDESNVDELANLCDNLVRFCPEDAIKDLYFKYGYNEKETKLEEDLEDDFDLDDFDFRADYNNDSNDDDSESDDEDLPKAGSEVGVSTLLIDAINGEWDTINLYHVIAVNAEEEGYKDIADVIKDITNEENVHVGQLQSALATLAPDTNKIGEGEQEGEEQLSENYKKMLHRGKVRRLKRI